MTRGQVLFCYRCVPVCVCVSARISIREEERERSLEGRCLIPSFVLGFPVVIGNNNNNNNNRMQRNAMHQLMLSLIRPSSSSSSSPQIQSCVSGGSPPAATKKRERQPNSFASLRLAAGHFRRIRTRYTHHIRSQGTGACGPSQHSSSSSATFHNCQRKGLEC